MGTGGGESNLVLNIKVNIFRYAVAHRNMWEKMLWPSQMLAAHIVRPGRSME